MTAITQCAIDSDFTRPGRKDFQYLLNHNRSVSASGCFSTGNDFGDIVRIFFWLELFVFLVELLRIFAFITRAARRFFGRFVGH